MVKTSVKFQKNRSKTVGGVAHTRYILYRVTEGRKDARTDGITESQKLCPSAFLRKGGRQKVMLKSKHLQDNEDILHVISPWLTPRNELQSAKWSKILWKCARKFLNVLEMNQVIVFLYLHSIHLSKISMKWKKDLPDAEPLSSSLHMFDIINDIRYSEYESS